MTRLPYVNISVQAESLVPEVNSISRDTGQKAAIAGPHLKSKISDCSDSPNRLEAARSNAVSRAGNANNDPSECISTTEMRKGQLYLNLTLVIQIPLRYCWLHTTPTPFIHLHEQRPCIDFEI